VSMANGIFQLSGGTILAMPYFCASSRMLLMYWTGSLNCSVVGRYVGASCRRVVGRAVVSALDRGEIQRLCLASAQRNRHDAVRLRARNRWHRNSAHSRSRCRRCAILRSAVPANPKGGDGGACRRPSLGHKVDHDTFAAAPGATTKSTFEITL
jgi:hypothetical protein